jgi:hypothetical protein
MTASWFFYAIFIAALITAAAHGFTFAAGALRRSTRWIWVSAIVVGATLPLMLSAFAPRAAPAGATPVVGSGFVLPAITIAASGRWGANWPLSPFIVLWLVMSVALLALLLTAQVRLARERRRWKELQVDGVAVMMSDTLGPAVCGWWDATIVVPSWFTTLPGAQRRLILAHEAEHRRAKDGLLLNVSRFAVLLMPWNPLLWYSWRRLQLAIECDCDDRVLRQTPGAAAYAETLLQVARLARGQAPVLRVALIEPSTFLARRISTMFAPRSKYARITALGASLGGLALLAAACMTREPTGARPVRQGEPVMVDASKPFFEFQVENPAAPVGGTSPRYPDALRAAGVAGEVVAMFVVDATGLADTASLKILRATRPEFAEAVKTALPGMRFRPAQVGDRAVRQLLQQEFKFAIAGSAPQSTAASSAVTVTTTVPGTPVKPKPDED